MADGFKKVGTGTKFPGVRKIQGHSFRVRAEYTCPKTGKRREIDQIVNAKDAEHASQIRTELRESAKRATVAPTRVRLDDFATSWVESCARRLKRSTATHYGETLDRYISPKLGDYFLDAITLDDIEAWFKAQRGTKQTINGRLRVLRALLESASKVHRIPNWAASVAEHRIVRTEDDHKVIEPGKLVALLAWLRENTDYHPIAFTLAVTGLRYSEAAGMKWGDVSFETRTIRIVRRWYRGDIDTPKNGRARTVSMPDELVSVLRARRDVVGEGAEWVFASKQTGTPVRQVGLAAALKRAGEAVGLEKRPTPHSFRYAWNDLLRKATTGEIQRAMTGHSSVAMSEHYSHVSIAERHTAADAAMLLLWASKSGEQSGENVEPGRVAGEGASAIELH